MLTQPMQLHANVWKLGHAQCSIIAIVRSSLALQFSTTKFFSEAGVALHSANTLLLLNRVLYVWWWGQGCIAVCVVGGGTAGIRCTAGMCVCVGMCVGV